MRTRRLYNVRTMTAKARETRDRRWDLRVAESEDALVRAASEQADTSFTGFVRGAAVSEARRVMADRTKFELEEPDWRAVMELLDRPPQLPGGLRDLFSKPSVFE
jgi:uncharacterized protein (DUF1778 family)